MIIQLKKLKIWMQNDKTAREKCAHFKFSIVGIQGISNEIQFQGKTKNASAEHR